MSFFGLINKKKKYEDAPGQYREKADAMMSFDLSSLTGSNKEKNMNSDELHTPNQNADISAPAPLPQSIDKNTGSVPVEMKTFDRVVYEMDAKGNPTQTPVNGLKASSAEELKSLYAMTGSRIQIIREYGGEKSQSAPSQAKQPHAPIQQSAPQPRPPVQFPQKIPEQKQPPKFFDIGGVKCKLEDGKMFPEQWVRVDSSKYRLVADATNKVVPMNGKHLEALKWVQIEDEQGEIENA